jgi:hypothetical protein
MTIANIAKETRRKVSARATILIGYIPVPKLDNFAKKAQGIATYRLFHSCMAKLLHPLTGLGETGTQMTCANGKHRRIHPILAAYVADHPEQCLVTCVQQNYCPKCLCEPNRRGENVTFPDCDQCRTTNILSVQEAGGRLGPFLLEGITAVFSPFWATLPHANIFACITPDILHQLHNGVFKIHLAKWCEKFISANEMDERYRCMSNHPDIHHFKNGIATVSQWTGLEVKEMEKVFLAVLAGAGERDASPQVLQATRSILEFIYYVSQSNQLPLTA